MSDVHLCTMCFHRIELHRGCDCGGEHSPPLCCPGCDCQSHEEAHPSPRTSFLGPKTKTIIVAGKLVATLPLARFVRDDGKPRMHVPRCPSHPGEPLSENAVCGDCIYGAADGGGE